MIKLMLSEIEVVWMQRILLKYKLIDENNASFNEIEAGYKQRIFAYWMLGY